MKLRRYKPFVIRCFLTSVPVIGVSVLAESPTFDEISPTPSLSEVFSGPFIADVARCSQETAGLPSDILLHWFGSNAPGCHMNPEEIQPAEGLLSFDAVAEYTPHAPANNLSLYSHVLGGHFQTADWVLQAADGSQLTKSPEHQDILRDRMETHIDATVDPCSDQVWAFNVVKDVIDGIGRQLHIPPAICADIDGHVEPGWQSVPAVKFAATQGLAPATTFQTRWTDSTVFLLASISDDSINGVEVFADGVHYMQRRDAIRSVQVAKLGMPPTIDGEVDRILAVAEMRTDVRVEAPETEPNGDFRILSGDTRVAVHRWQDKTADRWRDTSNRRIAVLQAA